MHSLKMRSLSKCRYVINRGSMIGRKIDVPPDHRPIAQAHRGSIPLGSLSRHPLTSLVAMMLLCLIVAGCEFGTRLASETPTGGMVIYPISNDTDILNSRARQDALRLMDGKCPNGYSVTTQGEVPILQKNIDRAWSGQMSKNVQDKQLDKMWGIEFTCK